MSAHARIYFIKEELRKCDRYCLIPRPQRTATAADGRAVAHTTSRQLPTSAARVRSQVRSCVTCGAHSGTAVGLLRVLLFPLPILFPLLIII
jgi:hypothetical protein